MDWDKLLRRAAEGVRAELALGKTSHDVIIAAIAVAKDQETQNAAARQYSKERNKSTVGVIAEKIKKIDQNRQNELFAGLGTVKEAYDAALENAEVDSWLVDVGETQELSGRKRQKPTAREQVPCACTTPPPPPPPQITPPPPATQYEELAIKLAKVEQQLQKVEQELQKIIDERMGQQPQGSPLPSVVPSAPASEHDGVDIANLEHLDDMADQIDTRTSRLAAPAEQRERARRQVRPDPARALSPPRPLHPSLLD